MPALAQVLHKHWAKSKEPIQCMLSLLQYKLDSKKNKVCECYFAAMLLISDELCTFLIQARFGPVTQRGRVSCPIAWPLHVQSPHSALSAQSVFQPPLDSSGWTCSPKAVRILHEENIYLLEHTLQSHPWKEPYRQPWQHKCEMQHDCRPVWLLPLPFPFSLPKTVHAHKQ